MTKTVDDVLRRISNIDLRNTAALKVLIIELTEAEKSMVPMLPEGDNRPITQEDVTELYEVGFNCGLKLLYQALCQADAKQKLVTSKIIIPR